MTRRLVVSYVGLAVLILLVLEIPLALLAASHERSLASAQAERVATGLAVVASEAIEQGRSSDLAPIAARYQAETGGEVAVVSSTGDILARSDNDSDNDVTGDQRALVQDALAGHPVSGFGADEGKPWAHAAVPITGGSGAPQGAVLLGIPAGATENRIHDIWLALGGFGLALVCVTALVGLVLARSLTSPLGRLEGTVNILAEGDLSVRARDSEGPPEIRSLANQFNHMAVRLQELVDSQARFVADASHQLRSPLTALRLRLENLEAGAGGQSAEGIAAAGREVQRLSRVVDGLLTLGRAGGDGAPRKSVDVAQVVAERCDAWSPLAEERRLHLHRDVSVSGESASLIPGDLDQMLDNLLANALEATPAGGTINVGLNYRTSGGLEIHVSDEGPGMSAEDRSRAFDRFWQGNRPTTGSSGLGLAIVRQLAARNDATVELKEGDPDGLDAVITLY